MLRYFLLSAIIFQLSQTCAYADDPKVRITKRIVLLLTEAARHEWCGRDVHVRACTHFVGLQLAATCAQQDETWRGETKASLLAFIALHDRNDFHHELLHIGDIRTAISSYLIDLEGASFPTASACEAAMTFAKGDFVRAVKTMAERSNSLRQ